MSIITKHKQFSHANQTPTKINVNNFLIKR